MIAEPVKTPFAPGETLPAIELERIRRERSDPRPTQFDYLHLKVLRDDIATAMREMPPTPGGIDVLDVFCGTRPYERLLPAGSRVTGLDVTGRYGAADVVSEEFLPIADASFDMIVCFEAFHFVADPEAGVAEFERVLRRGGRALITVPLVWEYERGGLEHRFTEPQLERLFANWVEVEVSENGGRGVAWATQTGRLLDLGRGRLSRRLGAAAVPLSPLFILAFLLVNGVGALIERSLSHGPTTLPMNLTVSARRP